MRVVGESGQVSVSHRSVSVGLMRDLDGNEEHLQRMCDVRFV